jgi:hypothetical protein
MTHGAMIRTAAIRSINPTRCPSFHTSASILFLGTTLTLSSDTTSCCIYADDIAELKRVVTELLIANTENCVYVDLQNELTNFSASDSFKEFVTMMENKHIRVVVEPVTYLSSKTVEIIIERIDGQVTAITLTELELAYAQ